MKVDGFGKPLEDARYYYIQESSTRNCVLWWKPNRSGYTVNLDVAGHYLGLECPTPRPTDIPWPVDAIDAAAHREVSTDTMAVIAKEAGRARVYVGSGLKVCSCIAECVGPARLSFNYCCGVTGNKGQAEQ